LNSGNLRNSSIKIFSIYSLGLSIVALAIVVPIAYADHGSTFRTELIEPGSEIISYRDSSNALPQSHTLTVDTSTAQAGFFTVNLVELEANLASVPSFGGVSGVDIVLATASSTTSDTVLMEFQLVETDVNSGEFTGILAFSTSGNNVDSLLISKGDDISIFYEPEFAGVSRFTAEYTGVVDSTGIFIGENWVEDPITGDISYECLEGANTAPYDLITYPIQINGPPPGDTITVTMSYANAWDGWENIYTTNQLLIVYRFTDCGAFQSLGGLVDTNAKTVTSDMQPPGGKQEGQYAVGVDVGGAPGGGGGGLVRPGFVVNALAGANVISSFFGKGGGGSEFCECGGSSAGPSKPIVTSGTVSIISDESIGFVQQGVTPDSDSTSNSLDSTQIIGIGEERTFQYNVYENTGTENLIHSTMYFFDAQMMDENDRIDVSKSETYIMFDKGKPVKVVDPYGYFEKASFEISSIDTYNLALNYEVTFAKIMPESHIVLRTWDSKRYSTDTLYPNALIVSETSIVVTDNPSTDKEALTQSEFELSPFLDTQYESQLTKEETTTKTGFPGIPFWVKNNAMWWHEKQIDDADFIAGIQYLINEEIIIIPDTTIAKSTSEEIPSWISNVAGFWSNNQISDDQFVGAMQWLVSNGVMEV